MFSKYISEYYKFIQCDSKNWDYGSVFIYKLQELSKVVAKQAEEGKVLMVLSIVCEFTKLCK